KQKGKVMDEKQIENRKKKDRLKSLHDRLWEVFYEVDKDCDKYINFSEFEAAMKILDLDISDKKRIEKAFKEVKTNESKDLINLEEFSIGIHLANPKFDLVWKSLYEDKQHKYIK